MSTWNEQAERIKNRKTELERKREERRDKNPLAFGWEKTENDTYRCLVCDDPHEYQRLPQCLRHVKGIRADGQTGLEEWA